MRARSAARRSGSSAISRRLACTVCASSGEVLVVKINGRALFTSQSITTACAATAAPATPAALPSVTIWISRSLCKPASTTLPRPSPSTPKPWASSTYSQASKRSASASSAASGAQSPSMLYTASTAISLVGAVLAASRRSSWARSWWAKRLNSARDNRQASFSEAWFSRSANTASPRPTRAVITARLA